MMRRPNVPVSRDASDCLLNMLSSGPGSARKAPILAWISDRLSCFHDRQEQEHHVVEVVLTEGLSLVIRWLHVVASIAWIGSSFYFIHLDLSLKARAGLPDGVKGDAWQVHGGGFYHMMKYLVAPARMPDALTWFK